MTTVRSRFIHPAIETTRMCHGLRCMTDTVRRGVRVVEQVGARWRSPRRRPGTCLAATCGARRIRVGRIMALYGQRTSGGVFSVYDEGYGVLKIDAPEPLISYQNVGITIEPAGGSPGPTGERVLGGDL